MFIGNPDATEEAMNEDLNSNNLGGILIHTHSVEVRGVLEDVQARHEQILRLAQSIEELQMLFLDMQHMVEAQEHIVIEVEDNIDDTRAIIKVADVELKNAVRSSRLSRRVYFLLAHVFNNHV